MIKEKNQYIGIFNISKIHTVFYKKHIKTNKAGYLTLKLS